MEHQSFAYFICDIKLEGYPKFLPQTKPCNGCFIFLQKGGLASVSGDKPILRIGPS